MSQLEALKQATTKIELATILKVNTSFLTKTLYIRKISDQYYQFNIPKRSGGTRVINAPSAELKDLQSRLSTLLLDCIDEINKTRKISSALSHGFARKYSIISNAETHKNQKNVLNIDLKDFFDSFNFGRVRGFFIKNKNFKLNEDIATVIAKIACLNNTLPQGSPCSPVITNLITHSLDIRLASLAKKNSCKYSRYADDITFSTRKKEISQTLVKIDGNSFLIGKSLKSEVERSGFSINHKKTRVQFKDSRQDVTGLIVNKKVNIKKEYWRTSRAMCHSLFMTGSYLKSSEPEEQTGTINELFGRLNFIDSVDRHNHTKPKGAIENKYKVHDHGLFYRNLLNVRERTFSKFLYFKYFYSNDMPTILCEGKTDNIYLKSAINQLSENYPLLAKTKDEKSPYKLKIIFIKYSKRTRFLLDLFGGGNYLMKFVVRFKDNYNYYKAPIPKNPVILLLDNDSGPKGLLNHLQNNNELYPNCPDFKEDMKKTNFIHLKHNLYIIFIPLKDGEDSCIEDFFDQKTLDTKIYNKTFDPNEDADSATSYGKNTFATKVVRENKNNISFEKFKPILQQIENVINHYNEQFV